MFFALTYFAHFREATKMGNILFYYYYFSGLTINLITNQI